MDQRRDQLCHWINKQLNQLNLYQGSSLPLAMVSGDASFRRYFRCHYPVAEKTGSVICVDAPPDKEDNRQFAKIAQQFAAAGVPVPQLLATDFDQGFMMLSDMGDCLLKHVLSPDNVNNFFATAFSQLLQIMEADFSQAPLPKYEGAKLQQEMELFRHWFCGEFLQLDLTQPQQQLLTDCFGYLKDQALQQAQVPVHRDFHTRNLMVMAEGQLGVIDFQDAVVGPVSYDLLSLLRDETFPSWPEPQVKQWVLDFAHMLRKQGSCSPTDQQFWCDFNAIGAQRHLKVAGIFARLHYRDNKAGYLQHTPQSLKYLMAELRQLAPSAPACVAELERWLQNTVVPCLDRALQQGSKP